MFNLKNIIMVCIMLHNICIAQNDPCEPQWRLSVKNLSLIKRKLSKRGEDNNTFDLISLRHLKTSLLLDFFHGSFSRLDPKQFSPSDKILAKITISSSVHFLEWCSGMVFLRFADMFADISIIDRLVSLVGFDWGESAVWSDGYCSCRIYCLHVYKHQSETDNE